MVPSTNIGYPTRLYLYLIRDKLKQNNCSESLGGSAHMGPCFQVVPILAATGPAEAEDSRYRGDFSIE
jgi:hypothetical protein